MRAVPWTTALLGIAFGVQIPVWTAMLWLSGFQWAYMLMALLSAGMVGSVIQEVFTRLGRWGSA